MADKKQEATTNGTNVTPEINEADIIEVKVPLWKKILKVLGYVGSAAAGALTVIIINTLGGDDDDEVETATESTEE